MADTQTLRAWVKGKSRPTNSIRRSSESYSGMHNPKVVGSNPTPATKKYSTLRRVFFIGQRNTLISFPSFPPKFHS